MKKFLKSAGLALLALVVVSCDKDGEVFDVNGGQTAYMFTAPEYDLGVGPDDVATINVEVGVTTRSNQDRTVQIYVDPSSTAPANQYTLSSTSVVIPAGEFVGNVAITGNFDNIPEGTISTIVLKIDDATETVVDKNQTVVSVFRSCPIEPGKFLGAYRIEQLTPINPADEVLVFENQIVTLAAVSGNTFARSFSAKYLEALGIGQPNMTVRFQLLCGEVIVNPNLGTGLSCGGTPGITLGPGLVPSSYDADDDSVFELTLTEYVTDGGCNAAPYQVTFRLTKQ